MRRKPVAPKPTVEIIHDPAQQAQEAWSKVFDTANRDYSVACDMAWRKYLGGLNALGNPRLGFKPGSPEFKEEQKLSAQYDKERETALQKYFETAPNDAILKGDS